MIYPHFFLAKTRRWESTRVLSFFRVFFQSKSPIFPSPFGLAVQFLLLLPVPRLDLDRLFPELPVYRDPQERLQILAEIILVRLSPVPCRFEFRNAST